MMDGSLQPSSSAAVEDLSEDVIDDSYDEEPVSVIEDDGMVDLLQIEETVMNKTVNNCKKGTRCPHKHGTCCPPHYLICCKFGCVQGVKATKCKPPPSSSAQKKWDDEQLRLGEDDYKERMAKQNLLIEHLNREKELEKQKKSLENATKQEQGIKRDMAQANTVQQEKTKLAQETGKKKEENIKKAADAQTPPKDLELTSPTVPLSLDGYRPPQWKIVDGICHLTGSVERKPDINGILATTDTTCRPAGRLVFSKIVAQAATVRVDVLDNGVINVVGGSTTSSWLPLDGISIIPAKSPLDLLDLSDPWVPYERGFLSPSYRKMGELCMLVGLARINNWNTADWVDHIATLPKDCRPLERLAFNVNHHENTHRVEITPEGLIMWMGGKKAHAWIALDGVAFYTNMTKPLTLAGDWKAGNVGSDSDFRPPTWRKHNNYCVLSGLVKGSGGDDNRKVASIPIECRPVGRVAFSVSGTVGGSTRVARFDVFPNGDLVWTDFDEKNFPAATFSLDGVRYLAP